MAMKHTLAVSIIYLILISAPAFPSGFGLYGTGGYGKADILKLVDHGGDYRVNYSSEGFFYGGGLLIESGNESEGYHNRFNLGLEGLTGFDRRFSYRRLMRAKIENVFAFRIAETDQVRFWIGPLLGVHLLTGLTNATRSDQWSGERIRYNLAALASTTAAFRDYGLYSIYFDRVWKRVLGVFIPIGIATGTNIRLGESASFTLEAGLRCGFYYLRKGGFNYEGYANAGFIFGMI